ncbi:MAG: tyrosine-type recombinase/integrase [Proteobacteria bacterium]|nr:tyrosine-type recombinase/integrase [Pseudomonadota bacterium]
MKITHTWLESRREPRNRPHERYDVTIDGREGLMARVFPSGVVSFRFRYRRGGRRLVMVLGEFGAENGLSLADAFDAHHQAQKELAKDLDPIEERDRRQADAERKRLERSAADTVASLVEQFVHRKLRAERWDAAAGQWVRDSRANIKARKRPDAAAALLGYVPAAGWLPGKRRTKHKPVPTLISELGHLKARDVTRRQLIAFLDGIVERGAPVTANRVHALLLQLFTWASAKDLIPASPMAGVERPGGEERPRRRVLTAEEVKAFWAKLQTADMAEPTRLALKLLLVTAQRRGELTFAKWSDFDLDGKLWTIPVELLKTSHARRAEPEPHVVPLSPVAIELLKQLAALTGEGRYVLPARVDKRKDRSYSERVLSRAVRENAKHFGIAHFTPHDLRRTAASFMTKIGVPRLHVEKVLNHSTGDIAEVYDRHDYLPEKRAALRKWGEHLQAIIDDKPQAHARVRHG